MKRRNFFLVLLSIHTLIDKLVTLLFGVKGHYYLFRLSHHIRVRLFPEYGPYIPNTTIRSPKKGIWLPPTIPTWVLDEMKDLGRSIDPVLYPNETFLAHCQFYTFPIIPKPGQIYAQIIQQCNSEHYTHCFTIPWLKRGGADLVALKHIEFAHKQSGTKVLVLITEASDSPWVSRIPSGIDVVMLSKYVNEIMHEEMLLVIARLFIQLQINVLHNINSRHVWDVISKYGLAITQKTRIFASLYCDDYDHDGLPVGYARQYLGLCYKHLSKVISDNSVFPQLLCQTYGYPQSLFEVVKVPAPTLFKETPVRPISITKKVLWAGRMDRQKRIDILLSIAEAMPDTTFTVFGTISIDSRMDIITRLKKLKNVTMMGSYDGPENLPFATHDVFLYTSQWDGMPNMILEAVSYEIPVVASCVGGVSDVINDKTGFAIQNSESIDDYINNINYIFNNLTLAEKRASYAKKIIENEYTQEKFKERLINIEGYF